MTKNKRRRSVSLCNINEIDIKTKRQKKTNFSMLEFKDYDEIKIYDYNLIQLKNIARHYKIKISGTKQQLTNRVYTFLYENYYANIIQKNFRIRIVRLWLLFKGKGLINRSICTNKTDFYTLENINEMEIGQFISIKENNLNFGFDICSLYTLITSNNENKNPYTQRILPSNLSYYLKRITQLQKCLNIDTQLLYETNDYQTQDIYSNENINHKLTDVFTKIDFLGNYTNVNWFTSLSYSRLIRYIRELYDIWNYRAQLTNETKRQICYPNGNPFTIHYNTLIESENLNYIRYQTLEIMNNLITKGTTDENKSLGAFYVLAALTLVNNEAAESMPWLYESVSYLHQF